MIPLLSSSTSFLKKIESFSRPCLEVIFSSAIAERIQKIAYPFFKGGSSVYLVSLGTAEIAQNICKAPNTANSQTITEIRKKTLNPSNAYLHLHGGLTLSSGFFTLLDLLNEFGVVNLGPIANTVCTAGTVLFLCANIFALEENVRLYNEIADTDWTKTNISSSELDWLKQSAIWGILSSLGYVVATAALLFSGATALTLVIALLSCFAGGIKILYDLAIWLKNHQQFMDLSTVSS